MRDPSTQWRALQQMATAERYNAWIAETIRPYLGPRILEVGCGIGNMTRYLLRQAQVVIALDKHPQAVLSVKQQYPLSPQLIPMEADIGEAQLVETLRPFHIDTVVCINVLEHIEDDERALSVMHAILGPGGHLVVYVPAGRCLYGTLDRALGHHRRYEASSLRRQMSHYGRLETLFTMNLVGAPGWFVGSRLLRRQRLSGRMVALFNVLTPLVAAFERRVKVPFGQSLVAGITKPK